MLLTKSKIGVGVLFCFAAAFCGTERARADEAKLTVEKFEKIHGDITSAKELWQGVPWHVSILEARSQAVKEHKPIYMLSRSGHPLGCV